MLPRKNIAMVFSIIGTCILFGGDLLNVYIHWTFLIEGKGFSMVSIYCIFFAILLSLPFAIVSKLLKVDRYLLNIYGGLVFISLFQFLLIETSFYPG